MFFRVFVLGLIFFVFGLSKVRAAQVSASARVGLLLNTLYYDAAGNLANISAGPGTLGMGLAPMALDWNVRGELVKWTSLNGTVATQDYGYDAWGERRGRTNSPAGTPSGFMYVGANRGKDLTTGMDSYVQTEP